jgi:hypothetical protein
MAPSNFKYSFSKGAQMTGCGTDGLPKSQSGENVYNVGKLRFSPFQVKDTGHHAMIRFMQVVVGALIGEQRKKMTTAERGAWQSFSLSINRSKGKEARDTTVQQQILGTVLITFVNFVTRF